MRNNACVIQNISRSNQNMNRLTDQNAIATFIQKNNSKNYLSYVIPPPTPMHLNRHSSSSSNTML